MKNIKCTVNKFTNPIEEVGTNLIFIDLSGDHFYPLFYITDYLQYQKDSGVAAKVNHLENKLELEIEYNEKRYIPLVTETKVEDEILNLVVYIDRDKDIHEKVKDSLNTIYRDKIKLNTFLEKYEIRNVILTWKDFDDIGQFVTDKNSN